MSASYLLSLSAMHAAAPSVLDVVFGADGDFEGAPYWVGPVTDIDPAGIGGVYHVAAVLSSESVATIESAGHLPLYSIALDCRIPSVAARLAGLCGLALGHAAEGARVVEEEKDHEWCLWSGICEVGWWYVDGSPAVASHPTIAPFRDGASFLAALTLSLAPRIAALRGPA